jgi:hypothetical protein
MKPRRDEYPAKSPPTPPATQRRRRIRATSLGSSLLGVSRQRRSKVRETGPDRLEPSLKRRDGAQARARADHAWGGGGTPPAKGRVTAPAFGASRNRQNRALSRALAKRSL